MAATPRRKPPARRRRRKPKPCPRGRKRVLRRGKRVCVPKRRPVARKPAPAPAVPAPVPQPVPPAPKPPAAQPPITSPIAVYGGPFGVRQAERLLWRAGFGPSPGHAQALAALGLEGAVRSLTRPAGPATLTGAEPHDGEGNPLYPDDAWGHDHLWFLDRMVRTNQPLVERMTLVWHDWFATSAASVSQRLMIDQNETFRANALGSFPGLVRAMTQDPAMILWLNQNDNTRWRPNENYARELMELFTLGADRGAYTEQDVRELARALTGWRSSWTPELGDHDFRFDPSWHDSGSKTVFGKTGAWNWQDACRMCVEHPLHPSFFVEKLWSYFIPVAPSAGERAALEALYVNGGREVRPVLEAILMHPALHSGPRMVKPPIVHLAGMLRALRRPIDTDSWTWLSDGTGQRLFRPPNVAGWDDERWLDTSTVRARWNVASYVVGDREISGTAMDTYDALETPDQAVAKARAFWGDPPLTAETVAALTAFATTCLPSPLANWQKTAYRAIRQNALRVLLATCPDLQTS